VIGIGGREWKRSGSGLLLSVVFPTKPHTGKLAALWQPNWQAICLPCPTHVIDHAIEYHHGHRLRWQFIKSAVIWDGRIPQRGTKVGCLAHGTVKS